MCGNGKRSCLTIVNNPLYQPLLCRRKQIFFRFLYECNAFMSSDKIIIYCFYPRSIFFCIKTEFKRTYLTKYQSYFPISRSIYNIWSLWSLLLIFYLFVIYNQRQFLMINSLKIRRSLNQTGLAEKAIFGDGLMVPHVQTVSPVAAMGKKPVEDAYFQRH